MALLCVRNTVLESYADLPAWTDRHFGARVSLGRALRSLKGAEFEDVGLWVWWARPSAARNCAGPSRTF